MSLRRKTVLVVDPDDEAREAIGSALRRGYRVLRAARGTAGIEILTAEEVDVVLTEIELPDMSGIELLQVTRVNFPLTEVVVVSSDRNVDEAVNAIKLGAFHFLAKPVDEEALRAIVDRAEEHARLNRRVAQFEDQAGEQGDREFITGPSPYLRDILDMVQRIAKLDTTVLIQGESGTGKELLARRLHRESEAPDGPFIAVNMAAIPRELVESTLFGHEKGAFTGALQQRIGKFELASGGTLFLDEIGDLPLDLQAKLLRALQEKEIERVGGDHPIPTRFRLIAATNVNLEQAVKQGSFRSDLFYRLNVIPMKLPPLRDRIEDLPLLIEFFIQRYNARFRKQVVGMAVSTVQMLSHYWWPGNIRELENLVERLVAMARHDWITDEDLPLDFQVAHLDDDGSDGSLLDRALWTFERNFIIRGLERSAWNVTRTAKYLGVPLSTLKFKMDRLDIRRN
ncbi:MAG: sigma-54-dependent Fis family transcriptional regulator [Acidobacteria bacterium]|nr:sigma-54-dependent Fis family transcriptional regulator [Acidobacteriota bacterium]